MKHGIIPDDLWQRRKKIIVNICGKKRTRMKIAFILFQRGETQALMNTMKNLVKKMSMNYVSFLWVKLLHKQF